MAVETVAVWAYRRLYGPTEEGLRRSHEPLLRYTCVLLSRLPKNPIMVQIGNRNSRRAR